ncbi:MAG TPA: hypothetical protein VKY74_08010 [Chloroflexia bacterium]|nr:hypothetical protein [Chloroflexia bacterium]
MKLGQQLPGVGWYLGTIQYCVFLFGGGAGWFLIARLTGFFWDNPAAQILACGLLLALIAGEAWWAHIPQVGNPIGDIIFDLVSSAAIAGFGMAVILAIALWVPR